jgi:hypothetical protein
MENQAVKNPRRWRNYLIYPRFQLAVVFGNILILLAGFIAIYYQVTNSFYNLDEVAEAKNILTNPYYKELVLIQERLILTSIFTTLIYCIVISVLFSILFTHKSVGAIYGVQKYFQEMAQKGYQRPINFRKGDLHPELPVAINSAIARLINDTHNKNQS